MSWLEWLLEIKENRSNENEIHSNCHKLKNTC